jgi:peptide/nickel transport system substrate-binding protein
LTTARPRPGGTLTILAHIGVDSLDPGRSYYMPGWQLAYATQRPLYSFRAAEQTLLPVPDLAAGPPTISADRRTVTVRIRDGVRFSPPVDRTVTTQDVKYALERFFSAPVSGAYTHLFAALEGAPSEPAALREIPGIETPDSRTLVFHLDRAVGPAFAAALSLPATAPVPREYAMACDEHNPSRYERFASATGPYMVHASPSGEAVGYSPGERLELVRNPNWDPKTDYKPAYLDRILFLHADNTPDLAQRVMGGSDMVLGENPPPEVAQEVIGKHVERYERVTAVSIRYIPLNTTVEPFRDVNVRRAVVAGFDRVKLRDARGGPFVGPVASHFLPPGFPGHEEAGGEAGPGFDFVSHPHGDMELAAEYMRRAGYPNGVYTGTTPLNVLVSKFGPARAQGDVVCAQLERMGFPVERILVTNREAYPEWCTVPGREVGGRKIAVYASAMNWQPDVLDPSSILEPLFAGWSIKPTGNHNFAQLADPQVDAAMRRADELTGQDRIRGWADVDRLVTAAAPGVPFVWETTTHLKSPNVHGRMNRYTSLWDVTDTYLD